MIWLRKSFEKELFFGTVAILTIFLFGILVSGPALKSLSLWDFSFLSPTFFGKVGDLTATIKTKLPSQDLFVEPVKNFLRESPEMTFIQKNSLIGISPPITINPQVLGSMLGSIGKETEGRRGIIEYVVEPGDTLSSIAAKFEISLETILWANDLKSKSIIKPGQKLIILPVSGIVYHVKKGDTLSEIAETYKGEVEEIVAFNELSDRDDIFIGDILIIPDGKMPSRVPYIAAIPVGESYFSIFPCEGKITQGLHYYNAIDIANSCGKPVVAVASGTVQRVKYGWNGGYGNYITILHPNGVVTLYAHLSKILVVSGQPEPVSAGDIIGYIGNTGRTIGGTGCHLHFEVRPKNVRNFLANYLLGTWISWKK